MVIAHGTVFHVTWLKEGRQKWIDEALKKTDNLFGEVAVACYLVIIAMSLPFVRRRLFELFRWAHIIFVPSFIVFILLHHGGGGMYHRTAHDTRSTHDTGRTTHDTQAEYLELQGF